MTPDPRSDSELNAIICRWVGKNPALFLPDYSKSLDAVAVAEDHLDTLAPTTSNNAPRYRYAWALYTLVPPERQPFRATARQRAEALVSVIESLAPHEKV